MEKAYEVPKVYILGAVQTLTEAPDKCSGSGDQFYPQILSPQFGDPCPPD